MVLDVNDAFLVAFQHHLDDVELYLIVNLLLPRHLKLEALLAVLVT